MARIGYARVSSVDQHMDLQRQALQSAGCLRIFEDHGVSGMQDRRRGLSSMLKALRKGDVLIVWRLDRLGRSTIHLISTIEALKRRGVGFISLTECIDTSSAGGQLVFHLLAALAQFERALIRERTIAGIVAARARGKSPGRRPALTEVQCAEIHDRLLAGLSIRDAARRYNVHPRTISRGIERMRMADTP